MYDYIILSTTVEWNKDIGECLIPSILNLKIMI